MPPLVVRAVVLANELGFEYSCLPEQGRLLRVLAAGRAGGRIGETGTGCGVGLAWMVSGASPGEKSALFGGTAKRVYRLDAINLE